MKLSASIRVQVPGQAMAAWLTARDSSANPNRLAEPQLEALAGVRIPLNSLTTAWVSSS
jgi:outer membrane biogenesis lipoprotein LolB